MQVEVNFTAQSNRFHAKFRENNNAFNSSFQNLQIVDYTKEPVIKPLKITENGEYVVPEGVDGFNPVEVDIFQVQGEEYSGSYEVTPKLKEQILQTSEKVMREDLKIKEIPITTVTNSSGGNTIIIGG